MADTIRGTIQSFLSTVSGYFRNANSITAQMLRDWVVSSKAQWSHWNVIINGGMDFVQRQAPGTYTTIAQDGYGPDRWRCCRENAELQYIRTDTNGALESGITARFYGSFKKITNTGKMLICQPVEGRDTFPLASRTVHFQVSMKASSAKTIRLGLLQLNSAGTIDTIPANIVPTTWGAASTDPTFGTNLAKITPVSIPDGSNGTINGTAVDCSVTTAWQVFGAAFTLPSDAKNIIPAIWSDGGFAALDVLSVAEAGLYDGDATRKWLPHDRATEEHRCERFFIAYGGDALYERFGTGASQSASAIQYIIYFPVEMRIAPTQSVSAVGDFACNEPGAALSTVTSFTVDMPARKVYEGVANVAGTPFTAARSSQLVANNTLNARLYFDAEL